MLMLRLQRIGRRNEAHFKIVVIEKSKGPKSHKYVDIVGSYNPKLERVQLDAEKVKKWLKNGVQPSDTMRNILITEGLLEGRKVNVLPKKSPTTKKKTAKPTKEKSETAEDNDESPSDAESTDSPVDEAVETPEPSSDEEAIAEPTKEETQTEETPEAVEEKTEETPETEEVAEESDEEPAETESTDSPEEEKVEK